MCNRQSEAMISKVGVYMFASQTLWFDRLLLFCIRCCVVLMMSLPEELPSPAKKQKNVQQKVSISPGVVDGKLYLNAAPKVRDWLCSCACVCPEETESGKEAGRLLLRGEELLQTKEAGGGADWCSGKLNIQL